METIRSFIAIELDKDAKKELAALTETLKKSGADVKWVNPDGIHLTMKFLGNVPEEKISGIKRILDETAASFKPFSMMLSAIGAFPKISYPRVIWVGVEEGKKEASEIYNLLESRLENVGFQKEKRPFSAHITLGRVRSQKNRESLITRIENLKFSYSKTINVGHLTLFQSTLSPHGSTYTALHESRFS